jgi:hypothetical protein
MRLSEIRDLAYRYVPGAAADSRLYDRDYGARSWWPAHEIGHFLVATAVECRQRLYGLDDYTKDACTISQYRYVVTKELAATAISQKLLRRSGHGALADDEIKYTDEDTLDCSFESWYRRSVRGLLRSNRVARLPTTRDGVEALLTRKARAVGTKIFATRKAAEGRRS